MLQDNLKLLCCLKYLNIWNAVILRCIAKCTKSAAFQLPFLVAGCFWSVWEFIISCPQGTLQASLSSSQVGQRGENQQEANTCMVAGAMLP